MNFNFEIISAYDVSFSIGGGLPSRAHAEMVFTLARQNIHGALPLPKLEKAAQTLQAGMTQRLLSLAAKADELAQPHRRRKAGNGTRRVAGILAGSRQAAS